jgi:arylsulfatase A-like enzyme
VTPHPFGPFARAALLTGVPSPENGVCEYYDPLPSASRTIAHALRARGYATGFFGKWHLAARDRDAPIVGDAHAKMIVPTQSRGGFEMWEGFESGFLLNNPWLHGTRLPTPVVFRGYQSDVLCERAGEWVAAQSPPWFCVVSVEPPHPPYGAASASVLPPSSAEIVLAANVPRGGVIESRAREELSGYYAHIEATDRAIGRLLDGVRFADTIVVITSVHGDMHGAHGLFRKGWPYEESIRVPLLVRIPGVAARKDQRAISLVELATMSIGWAGGGVDAVPRGTDRKISMPSFVALPYQCDRTWTGMRTSARKLVLNADGSPWLFFDLERDPLELENLVADSERAGELDEMRRKLRTQRDDISPER